MFEERTIERWSNKKILIIN